MATIVFALLDFVLGALIFLALAAVSIATIRVFRVGGLDGTPLIDLRLLFKDVGDNPHAYWWLYATYFSTLLPTVLHAFFAGLGLFDVVVLRVSGRAEAIVRGARKAELSRKLVTSIGYIIGGYIVGALAVAAALFGIYWFITFNGAVVANGVFWLMIEWAKLIGAL